MSSEGCPQTNAITVLASFLESLVNFITSSNLSHPSSVAGKGKPGKFIPGELTKAKAIPKSLTPNVNFHGYMLYYTYIPPMNCVTISSDLTSQSVLCFHVFLGVPTYIWGFFTYISRFFTGISRVSFLSLYRELLILH